MSATKERRSVPAERVRSYLAGAERPPALVVDVGWVNGVAAVRSLGRPGIPVLALDHRPSALGFRSRYALPLVCPDPGVEDEAFVSFVAELGGLFDFRAPVFPTHDEPLSALARGRGRLGDRFAYPFPRSEALAAIATKRGQLERAAAAGVATPRTAYPASSEAAREAADELGYPVVLKPSRSEGFKRRFGRQAFRCATGAEVERAYGRAEEFEPMVQELVPGGDETLYTLGSYLASDGEPLGLFCGRKLRQTPPGIGTCRVGEAVWVDDVVEAGLRLLRALEFHGVSQVEFKRDPRDGTYKLMEVNARLWQWHGLASACGVDVPLIAYRDLVGERPDASRMNGRRRRWAITLLSGERPIFPRPPYVDAVFARDDLRPGLAQAARVARSVLP